MENNIEDTKLKFRAIQDKTKNGSIVVDNEVMKQKVLGKLEHQLQMAKTKLSVAKNENSLLKKRVHDLRRDKILQLQIHKDLVSSIALIIFLLR